MQIGLVDSFIQKAFAGSWSRVVLSISQLDMVPVLMDVMVQRAGEGRREMGQPAGVRMSTVEGFLIHFWGKGRNQKTNDLVVAIITVNCQNPQPLRALVVPSYSFRKQTKL